MGGKDLPVLSVWQVQVILWIKLGVSDILLIKNMFVENMFFSKVEIL